MSIIRRIIVSVLMYYGIEGAKKPSFHGFFEQKVPECLSHQEK